MISRLASTVTVLIAAWARLAAGQGVVDRTPNLDDGWTVRPGIIQFNFLHRFEVSPPPARKVTSFPNFHLATGAPLGINVQLDYATNSTVFTGIPNEYQLGLRRPVLRQSRGEPLDVTVTGGYNFASESVDGEVGLVRTFAKGRVRLLGAVRGFTSGYDVQRSLWGAGSGLLVRVTDWLSVTGDVFDLINEPDALPTTAAWGAGLQLRVPYSPHTFSIQITNTQSASLEGSSRGIKGAHMAGFEFTIPFTLSRYFGRRHKPSAQPDTSAAAPRQTGDTTGATVVRIASLAFGRGEIHVRAGVRVQWVNGDQVQHSVSADDGSFDSGLIDPGKAYERVFDRPGTYAYHCTPHPFMTGRVVVEP
jgi:plastocyanin